ncbi:(2Fe-2S)-binding protein [Phenylobacterium montanum]|uniref:(2Fe-2S)-binding protein n=1 Tax=Phenylobacterium montanum TaxID=2823693 RepID=A0A975IVX8_9CAUL|nr:(2Fe-2S)-binding protein [Caulobacter sp. S6]QUD89477.1 (2Fe-2S)-binding protein [Caulobacter sp. S6]
MAMIEFTLNGEPARIDADESEVLLDVLRGRLGLFGARFGCGAGQCGACAVLVDGRSVAACQIEMATLAGKSVTTLEGLGGPERPHPLQAAFLELQAGQCGYCLSGILVSAQALLDHNPDPSRAEIAEALDWHLCRCGVHNRVMEAVALAARRMREGDRS